MSKKDKPKKIGIVYSTNPDFEYEYTETNAEPETLAPALQKLKVRTDTKQRNGKIATVIENFVGTTSDLETLGKQLKTKCGVGGTAKDGIILIQGDFKTQIIEWLKTWGYTQTK